MVSVCVPMCAFTFKLCFLKELKSEGAQSGGGAGEPAAARTSGHDEAPVAGLVLRTGNHMRKT